MKESQYNSWIPIDDEYIVIVNALNGNSDVVNDQVHDVFKNQDFAQCSDLLDYFFERGYLVKDDMDEKTVFEEKLQQKHQECLNRSKIHSLIVTYDCNFNCAYCFERYKNTKIGSRLTFEQVDRIFTIIQEFDQCQSYKNSIALFGGEPLLLENWDIIEYCLRKGHRLGYKFFVPTNGYTLGEYVELLLQYSFSTIQVTLDGSEEVHNQRKVLKNGETCTFERILMGVNKALEHNLPIRIRVNVDESNINSVLPLMQRLETEGWFENKNFSIYLSPCRHQTGRCFIDFDYAMILQLRESLKGFKYAHRVEPSSEVVRRVLERDNTIRFSVYNCDACYRQFFYDPYGNIYPCSEAIGNDAMIIGRYEPEFTLNEIFQQLSKRNLRENSSKCVSCKYLYLCSGGCPYRAFTDHGTVASGDCGSFQEIKKYLSNITQIKIAIAESE